MCHTPYKASILSINIYRNFIYFLGITDFLLNENILCFGPTKLAAQIESSKSFAKSFMKKYNVPTAEWASLSDLGEVRNHVEEAKYDALVVKADGLAAGKGVVVAENKEDAIQAAEAMLKVRVWKIKNLLHLRPFPD